MPRKRKLWQVFGTITKPQIARRLLHWLDLDEYPEDMKLTDTIQAVVPLPYPDIWHVKQVKAGTTGWKIGRDVPAGTYEVYARVTLTTTTLRLFYEEATLNFGTLAAAGTAVFWLPTTGFGTVTDTAYYDPVLGAEVRYQATINRYQTNPQGWTLTTGEGLVTADSTTFYVRYRRIA